jgi:hypothetical protein
LLPTLSGLQHLKLSSEVILCSSDAWPAVSYYRAAAHWRAPQRTEAGAEQWLIEAFFAPFQKIAAGRMKCSRRRLVLREFDAQPVEAHRVNEIIAETAALIANLDLVISTKYGGPRPRGRDPHCRPRGQNRN